MYFWKLLKTAHAMDSLMRPKPFDKTIISAILKATISNYKENLDQRLKMISHRPLIISP